MLCHHYASFFSYSSCNGPREQSLSCVSHCESFIVSQSSFHTFYYYSFTFPVPCGVFNIQHTKPLFFFQLHMSTSFSTTYFQRCFFFCKSVEIHHEIQSVHQGHHPLVMSVVMLLFIEVSYNSSYLKNLLTNSGWEGTTKKINYYVYQLIWVACFD